MDPAVRTCLSEKKSALTLKLKAEDNDFKCQPLAFPAFKNSPLPLSQRAWSFDWERLVPSLVFINVTQTVHGRERSPDRCDGPC